MWHGARLGGCKVEVVEEMVGVLGFRKRAFGGRGRRRRLVGVFSVVGVERRDGICWFWWVERNCKLEIGDEESRVGEGSGQVDDGSDWEESELVNWF